MTRSTPQTASLCARRDDYLFGILTPMEQDAFEAHLAECPACCSLVEEHTHVSRLFSQPEETIELEDTEHARILKAVFAHPRNTQSTIEVTPQETPAIVKSVAKAERTARSSNLWSWFFPFPQGIWKVAAVAVMFMLLWQIPRRRTAFQRKQVHKTRIHVPRTKLGPQQRHRPTPELSFKLLHISSQPAVLGFRALQVSPPQPKEAAFQLEFIDDTSTFLALHQRTKDTEATKAPRRDKPMSPHVLDADQIPTPTAWLAQHKRNAHRPAHIRAHILRLP